ncbi:flavodoxin family protein [Allorhizocola rhizosphaerae]|uniref:flavodoxin family protein n=1 Tax=Allorhizocola rhizosphaerae TaxID=1872709 RepID=UPI000E3DFA8E|nr:NAD(P)H-dependent oxidoreductase [Allorhizocola rhizosphaerae]
MRRFLFLLGSARCGGNTETLAQLAAAELPPGFKQRWLRLDDLPLEQFRDIRHEGTGTYPPAAGNELVLQEATFEATDIVFVSPIYWYSVSASTKAYMDVWTGWMRTPGVEFKARMRGKTLWAVTTFSDEDPKFVEPFVGTLRYCAEYLGMRWAGVLVGNSSAPGDVLRDTAALTQARTFFTTTQ